MPPYIPIFHVFHSTVFFVKTALFQKITLFYFSKYSACMCRTWAEFNNVIWQTKSAKLWKVSYQSTFSAKVHGWTNFNNYITTCFRSLWNRINLQQFTFFFISVNHFAWCYIDDQMIHWIQFFPPKLFRYANSPSTGGFHILWPLGDITVETFTPLTRLFLFMSGHIDTGFYRGKRWY